MKKKNTQDATPVANTIEAVTRALESLEYEELEALNARKLARLEARRRLNSAIDAERASRRAALVEADDDVSTARAAHEAALAALSVAEEVFEAKNADSELAKGPEAIARRNEAESARAKARLDVTSAAAAVEAATSRRDAAREVLEQSPKLDSARRLRMVALRRRAALIEVNEATAEVMALREDDPAAAAAMLLAQTHLAMLDSPDEVAANTARADGETILKRCLFLTNGFDWRQVLPSAAPLEKQLEAYATMRATELQADEAAKTRARNEDMKRQREEDRRKKDACAEVAAIARQRADHLERIKGAEAYSLIGMSEQVRRELANDRANVAALDRRLAELRPLVGVETLKAHGLASA